MATNRRNRSFGFSLGFLLASLVFCAQDRVEGTTHQDDKEELKRADKSFEQFQTDIIALLKNLDPNPKDKKVYKKTVRKDLYKIVDKYSAKLRPDMGIKKYVSIDKTFVLVIAAGATSTDKREIEVAKAIDDEAKIVVAIAGDGDSEGRPGGNAIAKAKRGVTVALGGRGLGGGGAAGKGGIGSVLLDGEGTRKLGNYAITEPGGDELGITNAKAIIDELKGR